MTLALSLIALVAFTIVCAMSFLIVTHLPLSAHRAAGRHGRFANEVLERRGVSGVAAATLAPRHLRLMSAA